jgi:hypothetical protein
VRRAAAAALAACALCAACGCDDVSAPIPRGNPGANRDPSSPYFHQVFSATSQDGETWTRTETILLEHASQPAAVRRDGDTVTFLYFLDADAALPDTLAVVTRAGDGATLSARRSVTIDGAPASAAAEPCAVTSGDTIRLFYRATQGAGASREIHSAWSVDGVTFRRDADARLRTARAISDPDVFRDAQGAWIMLLSAGDSLFRARSTAPTATFVEDDAVFASGVRASATFPGAGGLRTCACRADGVAIYRYGEEGLTDLGVRAVARRESEEEACDATVARSASGGYELFFRVLPGRADQ